MKKKEKRLAVLASVGPYAAETLLLVVLPLLYVCLMSIMTRPSYGGVEFTVSFNGYKALFEKAYLVAIWNSVRMSLVSTVIILLVSYPMAYMLSRCSRRVASNLIILMMIPYFTNSLIRLYSYITLFNTKGILTGILDRLGMTWSADFLYSESAVVLGLVLLEPHMSGILLTTAIVGTILLLGGSGGIITWAGGASAVLLLRTVLEHIDSIPYLQSRLDGWTHDLSKMTDQTLQSLYAIGSGGVTGLGLGNSIEKQLWLPESTNDFIFSVVCEELGFVGAVIVILLFVLFLVQGLWLAFHAENRYCTLVGIGIMAQIAWQVFCNIAVVTNTLPNTGISLPFFSSGGTSLILLLAEMGVMINIGRGGERARLERENLRALREQREKEKSNNTIRLDPNMGY